MLIWGLSNKRDAGARVVEDGCKGYGYKDLKVMIDVPDKRDVFRLSDYSKTADE
jgi:hypothetical protein